MARIAALRAGALATFLALACTGLAQAQPRPCDPMTVEGFEPPVSAPAPPTTTDPALVPVSLPVVVHFMKLSGSSNDVASKVTPQMLIALFAEGKTIDAIWRQAGIRLYLQRFERCTFSDTEIPLASQSHEEIASPVHSAAGRERFRPIADRYNAPDVRGVDLYVWWGIKRLGGYADRWLDSGPLRGGAAWIDTDCMDTATPYCDLLVAHEVGHFLGLCHACSIGQAVAGVTCVRCLPESMKQPDGTFALANCGQVPGNETRIMRSDNLMTAPLPYTVSGSELSVCERHLANTFARTRLNTAVNFRGRDDMGGGGMGKLQDTEKHVVMLECKGPVDAATAAKFTKELHDLLDRYRAKVTFDMTGDIED